MPEKDQFEISLETEAHELTVGTTRIHERRGKQSMTFQYANTYVGNPLSYELDPSLPLGLGIFTPQGDRSMFGVFADSAPDRWGRNLMRRAEQRAAAAEGRRARTLGPIDFLLGVRDVLRQGSIRLRSPGTSDYLAAGDLGVPELIGLPRLLGATDELVEGRGRDKDLKDLLRAGGSLGGARPKAAVLLRDGSLAIAKFPDKKNDDWDVALWERVEGKLAALAGIDVAESQLIRVLERNVLISKRFDREGSSRIGFMSAMTMLEAKDADARSYIEIANGIERYSSNPNRDLEELFRRIVFSILTNNTDDHLRNHGFLRRDNGWQLSPAYDLNPNPDAGEVRTTALDPDGLNASMDSLCSVSNVFRLSPSRTREIVDVVEVSTRQWNEVAKELGAVRDDLNRMTEAFETEHRSEARRFADTK